MIVLKLCAIVSVVFSVLILFELVVDIIQFGGARMSNGTVQSLGASLGMAFLFLAMLVSGIEGLRA